VSQQPFGDIPLFRELQKLLSATEGPLNTELASQVAMAIAVEGGTEGRPDPEAGRSFDQAVHAAEMLLSGYTRLGFEEPSQTELLRRSEWVDSTLASWRWLLEVLSTRFTSAAQGLGEGETQAMPGAEAVIGQLAPLLLGLQAGTLVGHLSREALGRYDLPIPRDDKGRLFLVDANATAIAADYGFKIEEFRTWLALRETSRHLIGSAHPWVERYLRNLMASLIDAIEIDVGDLQRRIVDMQSGGSESLEQGFGSDQSFPIAATERHAQALRRLQAFVAIFEGYAAHAVGAVAPQMIESLGQIEEGMSRHNASHTEGKSALNGILGITPDRALQTAGTTFCAAVVKLQGIEKLNVMWAAPDNLPTSDEVRDPFAWIERVLE
jgi:putative hydrolase